MRERPEDRWWRAGGLAIAAFGMLLGGWVMSRGFDLSMSNIDFFGDEDVGRDSAFGELLLLVGFVGFVGAPKVGARVSRRAPVRHGRRWVELAALVPVLLPDWGERAGAAKLFLVVAGVSSLAVRPQRWDHRIAGLGTGCVVAAAFGRALHPGLWLACAALVASEAIARPRRRTPVSPDFDVEFVWREVVVYWEGDRGYSFHGGWGVRPFVTYVPSASAWDDAVPAWLRGRRREVLDRLASVDGHVLRTAPPPLVGAETTLRRYP